LLIGSALASGGSILEAAGTDFIGHGGSFSQLLTEATPAAPLLPKPCLTSHNTMDRMHVTLPVKAALQCQK